MFKIDNAAQALTFIDVIIWYFKYHESSKKMSNLLCQLKRVAENQLSGKQQWTRRFSEQ